jgi:hypothetical protein
MVNSLTSGTSSSLRTWLARLLCLLLTCVGIETAAQLAYRVYTGRWYVQDRRADPARMCQLHPYLEPVPRVAFFQKA